MQIDRTQVVAFLVCRGDLATAAQAEMSLPRTIDTDKDKDLLDRFGVDLVAIRDTLTSGSRQ